MKVAHQGLLRRIEDVMLLLVRIVNSPDTEAMKASTIWRAAAIEFSSLTALARRAAASNAGSAFEANW